MTDGYFPRGTSVLRAVMDERIVSMLYGQRALLIGALEPLAFVGTVMHSRASRDGRFYRRLHSTALMFDAVIQSNRATADRALRRVSAMHRRVGGTLTEDLSPHHPAGTTYAADDPWLAWFTMAVLCDSAHALYETYVGRLDPDETEAFHEDWNRFGALFGMPEDAGADGWAGFRDRFDGWLNSDRVHLLPLARSAGLASFQYPLPLPLRGVNDLQYLLVVGTLPRRVRDEFGLPWHLRHRAAHAALTRSVRTGRRVLPGVITSGRALRAHDPAVDHLDRRNLPRVRRSMAHAELEV